MSDEAKGTESGKVVHLVSQEGDQYEVEVAVCKMSELVKTMLPDGMGEGGKGREGHARGRSTYTEKVEYEKRRARTWPTGKKELLPPVLSWGCKLNNGQTLLTITIPPFFSSHRIKHPRSLFTSLPK